MTSRRHRHYRTEWVVLGMVLLALAGALGYSAYEEHRDVEAMEGDRLEVQARVVADNLERQLVGVSRALVGIRQDLIRWNGGVMTVQASRRLDTLSDVMPGVRTLLIANADGEILDSNRKEFVGTGLAERRDFKALRTSADATLLHVSPPFKTPDGVVAVNITLAVTDAKGAFAGLVSATLDPEYFNVLLRSVLYAPDMRAVVTHWDGGAFLFMPPREGILGLDLASPGSFFSLHRDSGQVATLRVSRSIVTGEERMMASHTLRRPDLHMDKPFIIHVSRNLSAIFADWRRDVYLQGGMFAVLLLISTSGLALNQRRRRFYDRLEASQEAERSRVEQDLRQSEERFRSLIEWSPEPLAVHRNGKWIYANPAAIKLFGAASAQQLAGKPVLDLIHPDSRQIVREQAESIARGASAAPMVEARCLKLDGTPIDLEVRGTSIVYDGEPAIQVSLRDVTERKRAEATIRMTAERLQIALEGSQISVWETDLRTNEVRLDAAWAAFLGAPPVETRTTFVELLKLVHPDDQQGTTAAAVEVQTGRIASFAVEHRVKAANGEWRWILSRGRVIERDAGGRPLRMSGTNTAVDERKRADEALRLSDHRLQEAVRASGIGIFDHDHRADTIYWSPRQRENYGWGPDETVTLQRFVDQIHPDDRERIAAAVMRAHDPRGDGRFDVEHRIVRRDGAIRWLTTRSQTFFEGEGTQRRPLRTIGAVLDITERKQADEALSAQSERLRIGQSTARLIVMEWDVTTGEITWSDSPEWLRGPLREGDAYPPFEQQVHADDRGHFLAARAQALETRQERTLECRFVRTDGEVLWLRSQHMASGDASGKPARMLTALLDITDYKRAQQHIEFLAHQDALTTLPNRLLFRDRMEQAMAHAVRDRGKVAVLFLDLDSFKTINDSLGHAAGDQLLQQVAAALRECIRETDTVSRQGGDEFLIMLPALPDAEAVMPVVEKLMERFRLPFEVEGEPMNTSVSIGIAIFPEDGRDFDTLLKNADMAMYRAKDAGRNTYRFYDKNMNVEAVEHLHMRNGLRAAIDARELVLHYQPQIDLQTGAVVGAEALLRWNHRQYGTVLPERFIAIAEDTGLIVPIGDWVLHEACRQMAAWRKAGLPEISVAVNLSAVQFRRGDLERTVMSALENSGLDPTMLELELTESILIRDTDKTLAMVRRLKALGVRLSIDDFGTGYSSLSYLKRFAVDKLKIDQSFIRDLAVDADDTAIVRAIIQMAISLELRTIAEGVEDEALVHRLRIYKCDEAQGYHFARPMAAAEFADYLTRASMDRSRIL